MIIRPAPVVALAAALLVCTAAEATKPTKPVIHHVRVRQVTGTIGGVEYRFGVVVPPAGPGVTQEVSIKPKDGTPIPLVPGPLRRRASVHVYAGESPKGFIADILLGDAQRNPILEGTWQVPPGSGARKALSNNRKRYRDGNVDFEANALNKPYAPLNVYPTTRPGAYVLSFAIEGDGSGDVATGTITIKTVTEPTDSPVRPRGDGDVPEDGGGQVVSVTPLDGSLFEDEREFWTPVSFDGDPVGAVCSCDVTVTLGRSFDKEKVELQIVELPGQSGDIFGIPPYVGKPQPAFAIANCKFRKALR